MTRSCEENTPNLFGGRSPVSGSAAFRIVFASTSGHTDTSSIRLIQDLEELAPTGDHSNVAEKRSG